ncbi:MAG: hypothetical protein ABIR47_14405, partial [Candidatus Kapaibacterium sp.]
MRSLSITDREVPAGSTILGPARYQVYLNDSGATLMRFVCEVGPAATGITLADLLGEPADLGPVVRRGDTVTSLGSADAPAGKMLVADGHGGLEFIDAPTGGSGIDPEPWVYDYRRDFKASTSTVTTDGAINLGSKALLVVDIGDREAGQGISVDGAGDDGGILCTEIDYIDAPMIMLKDAASTPVTDALVQHDNTICMRKVRGQVNEDKNVLLRIGFGPGGLSDCIYEHRGGTDPVGGVDAIVAFTPHPLDDDG